MVTRKKSSRRKNSDIRSEIESFEKAVSSLGTSTRRKSLSPMKNPRARADLRRLRKTTLKAGKKKNILKTHLRIPAKKRPALALKPLTQQRQKIRPLNTAKAPVPPKEPAKPLQMKFIFHEKDNDNLPSSEEPMETNLDKLYMQVKKMGSLPIREAADMFSVPESTIEEWALVLEEHELITVHYPKFGKPTLVKKTPPEEKEQKTKGKTKSTPSTGKPKAKIIFPMLVTGIVIVIAVLPMVGITIVPNFFLPFQGNEIYLIPVLVLIVCLVLVATVKKKKRASRKET